METIGRDVGGGGGEEENLGVGDKVYCGLSENGAWVEMSPFGITTFLVERGDEGMNPTLFQKLCFGEQLLGKVFLPCSKFFQPPF